MSKLAIAKKIIKEYYKDAEYGIFKTRNSANDVMTNVYAGDGVYIDICYEFEYFEVFGLTAMEFSELEEYYLELTISKCIDCPYAMQDYETYYNTTQKQYFICGCKLGKDPGKCGKE